MINNKATPPPFFTVPLSKAAGGETVFPLKIGHMNHWKVLPGSHEIFDRCPILFSGLDFSITVMITYTYLGWVQSVAELRHCTFARLPKEPKNLLRI